MKTRETETETLLSRHLSSETHEVEERSCSNCLERAVILHPGRERAVEHSCRVREVTVLGAWRCEGQTWGAPSVKAVTFL